jgi:hypothetical protein
MQFPRIEYRPRIDAVKPIKVDEVVLFYGEEECEPKDIPPARWYYQVNGVVKCLDCETPDSVNVEELQRRLPALARYVNEGTWSGKWLSELNLALYVLDASWTLHRYRTERHLPSTHKQAEIDLWRATRTYYKPDMGRAVRMLMVEADEQAG